MENKALTVQAFREAMKAKGLNAYIIPSSDPHLSEYPAEHWKSREWISGFDGSAGTVVLTETKGALFTDSRYFLQAEIQLAGSGIELVKMGLPDSPSIPQWLCKNLEAGTTVGIDPWVYGATEAMALEAVLAKQEITLSIEHDIVTEKWNNRPELPLDPLFLLPLEFSGCDTPAKIDRIREKMRESKADYLLVSALDEIAWIFNIRGNDVIYNPVVIAYAVISQQEAILFVNPKKVNNDELDYFKHSGVILAEYGRIETYLSKLPEGSSIIVDCARSNYALYNAVPVSCRIINEICPANHLKACKNETEINGFRQAMKNDGVALTRFFMWLDKALDNEIVTECTIGEKLKEFRSQQPGFAGEGFGTITGYQDHGAIVHYHPTPENAYTIKREGMLLIDSGGQYFSGTTDITRTITLSAPTQQQMSDFTLVLKGHIALATASFPQKTRGSQLDILARKALWDRGMNYLHGTGHGVGHFLNVHEGPQSIRTEENPVTLEIGMVMSNEPAFYRNGEYGLRTENMIVVKEKETTPWGTFYEFETMTLCPLDRNLIDVSMLTVEELEWVNNYHQRVFNELSPLLNEEEKTWLQEKTATL